MEAKIAVPNSTAKVPKVKSSSANRGLNSDSSSNVNSSPSMESSSEMDSSSYEAIPIDERKPITSNAASKVPHRDEGSSGDSTDSSEDESSLDESKSSRADAYRSSTNANSRDGDEGSNSSEVSTSDSLSSESASGSTFNEGSGDGEKSSESSSDMDKASNSKGTRVSSPAGGKVQDKKESDVSKSPIIWMYKKKRFFRNKWIKTFAFYDEESRHFVAYDASTPKSLKNQKVLLQVDIPKCFVEFVTIKKLEFLRIIVGKKKYSFQYGSGRDLAERLVADARSSPDLPVKETEAAGTAKKGEEGVETTANAPGTTAATEDSSKDSDVNPPNVKDGEDGSESTTQNGDPPAHNKRTNENEGPARESVSSYDSSSSEASEGGNGDENAHRDLQSSSIDVQSSISTASATSSTSVPTESSSANDKNTDAPKSGD